MSPVSPSDIAAAPGSIRSPTLRSHDPSAALRAAQQVGAEAGVEQGPAASMSRQCSQSSLSGTNTEDSSKAAVQTCRGTGCTAAASNGPSAWQPWHAQHADMASCSAAKPLLLSQQLAASERDTSSSAASDAATCHRHVQMAPISAENISFAPSSSTCNGGAPWAVQLPRMCADTQHSGCSPDLIDLWGEASAEACAALTADSQHASNASIAHTSVQPAAPAPECACSVQRASSDRENMQPTGLADQPLPSQSASKQWPAFASLGELAELSLEVFQDAADDQEQ